MSEPKIVTYADFVLPSTVVSKIDVSRLVSEFERVDNELTAISVRAKTGSQEHNQPVMSQQLADFMEQNKLSFDDSRARSDLVEQMRLLKDNVPIIHMTFAVTADQESLEQLAVWLRGSIHPQATIAVGLQPALVAGVYLRTPNHVHDFSLRGMLASSHDVLVKELESLRG